MTPHRAWFRNGVTSTENSMSSKERAGRSGSARSTKQPLALNAAIREFSKSLGITKKLREYTVVTAWRDLVGEQIAKVTTPQRIENGTLHVSVATAPWRTELSMRKREIINKINHSLGKNVVADIRFR